MRAEDFNWGDTQAHAARFAERGITVLRGFLSEAQRSTLLDEIENLMPSAMRKDMLMPQSGHSPRHMSVVGGRIMNNEPLFTDLYYDPNLRSRLNDMAGEDLSDCPELVENIIATALSEPGDTHGWHTDDYRYAFIICLKASTIDEGGQLEVEFPDGRTIVELETGDGYLMRTDTMAHRVTPLQRPSERVILNFTYGAKDKVVKPNGSAQLLCC